MFSRTTTADEVLDGVDLTGRRALVTGGGAGLGLETARALRRAGAAVTVAVRSTAPDGFPALHLDLADPASVRRLVDEWRGPLHILVNNAGGILPTLQRTPQGWELQFATNHIGHFALATGLHPALAAAGGARIVTLSSSGHLYSPVVFDDVHFRFRTYTDLLGYGQAKTANILFGVGAAVRWAGDGITANAAMPGPVLTGFQRHMDPDRLRQRLGGADPTPGTVPPGWKTPAQGVATTVLLAASPLVEGVSGGYFEDCRPAVTVQDNNGYASGVAPYALDPANADRLWTMTERLLAE